jgi:cold-inducible RNA-binding protein
VNIYIGNLSFQTTDPELESLFSQHGQVTSARVMIDRDTGRSRGFGFVEMANDNEARAAIAALNGAEFGGRALTVNEARPKESRAGGRPGGGGWRSGGGGGGGGRSSGGESRGGGW